MAHLAARAAGVADPQVVALIQGSIGFLACPTFNVLRDDVEDCAHSRFAPTRCS